MVSKAEMCLLLNLLGYRATVFLPLAIKAGWNLASKDTHSCQIKQFPFPFWTYCVGGAGPLGQSWAKCPQQLSAKPLPGLLVALLNIIKEQLYQELCALLLIEVPCLLPCCYCAKPHVTLIYLVFPALLSCVLTYAQGEKRTIHSEFVGCNSTFF